jgi:predicted HTH domain antitoxin
MECMMELLQRVRKTDLARNTRKIIRDVLRGKTAIVESHGLPEVAIVDVIDYYLKSAALHYFTQSPEVNTEEGLPDETIAKVDKEQERYNLVLTHYLGESISLGRAAELLNLPWLDLRMRLARLDIPLHLGPRDVEELRAEIKAIEEWEIQ